MDELACSIIMYTQHVGGVKVSLLRGVIAQVIAGAPPPIALIGVGTIS